MSEQDAVKNVLRTILLVWFIVISVYIFYATCKVLPFITQEQAVVAKPAPLPALVLIPINQSADAAAQQKIVEENQRRVAAYTHEVAAYTQSVAAYKAHVDSIVKSPQLTAYDTIVKGTLAGFFTSFIVAFLGYVFAKASLGIAENFFRMKLDKEPLPITLL